MNRPALEALRDSMRLGTPVSPFAVCVLLDALLAHDALPSSAAVDAYLVRMEGHDRDYVACAAYDRDQKAIWHRMALEQHVAGLVNWSA